MLDIYDEYMRSWFCKRKNALRDDAGWLSLNCGGLPSFVRIRKQAKTSHPWTTSPMKTSESLMRYFRLVMQCYSFPEFCAGETITLKGYEAERCRLSIFQPRINAMTVNNVLFSLERQHLPYSLWKIQLCEVTDLWLTDITWYFYLEDPRFQ